MYQLSLDGMRETHDWFRKPGSFDCTLEKIGCIKRAGIRSVIMTTVSGLGRFPLTQSRLKKLFYSRFYRRGFMLQAPEGGKALSLPYVKTRKSMNG